MPLSFVERFGVGLVVGEKNEEAKRVFNRVSQLGVGGSSINETHLDIMNR
jgi:hypothetical protein